MNSKTDAAKAGNDKTGHLGRYMALAQRHIKGFPVLVDNFDDIHHGFYICAPYMHNIEMLLFKINMNDPDYVEIMHTCFSVYPDMIPNVFRNANLFRGWLRIEAGETPSWALEFLVINRFNIG